VNAKRAGLQLHHAENTLLSIRWW